MADPILTPEFRVSFPQVFKPARVNENDDPKYSVTMLFDEEARKTPQFKAMIDGVKAVLAEKFGDKVPANIKKPFRKGEEKEHLDGYVEGVVFTRASTEQQPEVVDRNKQDILSERDFYAGCFARAFVVPFYYDKAGNKGVSFGLRSIQKTRDGEAFGGGGSYADRYDDDLPPETGTEGGAEAPAAGGDDDFLS